MSRVLVEILLGSVTGEGGQLDSRGMIDLRDRLNNLPDVICAIPLEWAQWESAYTNIDQWLGNEAHAGRKSKVAVIGYSGGGSRATWLANKPPLVDIDLMVLYDPSPEWQMKLVWQNVKRAVVYQNQPDPLMFGLGGGVLQHSQYLGVDVVQIHMPHLWVQRDEDLHNRTVEEVQKLTQEA